MCPMQRPELPPEKRPSVTSADLTQALGLEIAGRVEHLLHARGAARAFVTDEDDIAGNDPVAEDDRLLHRGRDIVVVRR